MLPDRIFLFGNVKTRIVLRNSFIISLLILFVIAGCSPERKLARKFIRHQKGAGLMIIPVYELYKDNLSISYDTAIQYNALQLDSIAWAQSCFIQHVSDSIFLTQFTNSMIDELAESGFDIYVDGSSDVFLSLPDPKWMVQIAQLQLEEDHQVKYFEVAGDEGNMYYEDIRLNTINLQSWLDVSRANSGNKQTLYLQVIIDDDYQNAFNNSLFDNFLKVFNYDLMLSGFDISDSRDSLNMSSIYMLARQAGQKHGELLFDYFMNDYIRENLPAGIINRKYFHYNRQLKKLKQGLKERFDVVN